MAKLYYIEGTDYAGKTTLINDLSNRIKEVGKTVLVLKEPAGDIRTKLLSKEENLSWVNRRLLFMESHVQVKEKIMKEFNNYDFILVDRCAIISDIVYAMRESIDTDHSVQVNTDVFTQNLINFYFSTDTCIHNSFLLKNAELIMLSVNFDTFFSRVSSRAINENDALDSKDMKFKQDIWMIYKMLIDVYSEKKLNSWIGKLFNKVSVYDCAEASEKIWGDMNV